MAGRMRAAVQYCKEANNMGSIMHDRSMDTAKRMVMERCLTENFLLKLGMDYFGKRDLLYIDMRGDADVARLYDMERLPKPFKRAPPKKEAAGGDDEGGDDGDDDAGDDDE